MTQKVNQKTYKMLIEQDIEWLKSMIEANCPNSLEGKHILNILENEKEKSNIYKLDECFEEYCCTKCPEYENVFIGSLECHKCPKFVSEENSEGFSSIINCKE